MNRKTRFLSWLREYKKMEQIISVDRRVNQHLFDAFCAGANYGRDELVVEVQDQVDKEKGGDSE